MRTRIKICGITRVKDAEVVAESGADAMGMIFYSKSPRYIELEQSKALCESVQSFVTTVGVVVNPSISFLNSIKKTSLIDRIQFHGEESIEDCLNAPLPFYKAFRVANANDLAISLRQFNQAPTVLLDTYVKDIYGGSGLTFDWSILHHVNIDKPFILAGGITSENVYDAISAAKPYAVDISSAVETKPGIKDATMINEFIIAVREADNKLNSNY